MFKTREEKKVMENIQKQLEKIGHKAVCKVTGAKGVITSISFDLYGCIQAAIDPGLDKDGKRQDGTWYDTNRLKITSKKPVMKVPSFVEGPAAEGELGPAPKLPK